MTRILLICLSACLLGCNSEKINSKDVAVLINSRIAANEKLLEQMESFVNQHGSQGYENQSTISSHFKNTHAKVRAFLDSLDNTEYINKHEIAAQFVYDNFQSYSINTPYEVHITENSPTSLIKLQIVDLEHVYLREWHENVNHRFNKLIAVIAPDTLSYKDKKITGTVGFMAYADNLNLKIRLNGDSLETKNGRGYFSIDKEKTKGDIKAEIIFPDTTYTANIIVRQ